MSTADWDSFATGLADELSRLEAGSLVVVREPAGRYTQFSQEDAELVAHVVSNEFLDDPARATPDDERTIATAGWNPPTDTDPWWHTVLPWPATSQQYRRLAHMVVTALRDGYHIPTPTGFAYEAWNDRKGNAPFPMPGLGLPRQE